ncbi:hypothetical protein EYC80_004950 [Monilinia laxa]|nr:hypothetical protein EYC80_004950 [Monilinia laxa]
MTYGRAPFGHIQNQLQRCQAIINFNYDIEYPAYGVGGILVPSSLIRTLKNCLNRDQHQRPSADELLGDNDTFLNPLEIDMDKHFPMSEELLGRILQNVIQKCEALGRVPSEAELLTAWPKGYFTSLRKAEQRVSWTDRLDGRCWAFSTIGNTLLKDSKIDNITEEEIKWKRMAFWIFLSFSSFLFSRYDFGVCRVYHASFSLISFDIVLGGGWATE